MSGFDFESTFDGSLNQKQLRNAVYSEILMHLTSQISNDDLSDRNEYVYNNPKINARGAADRFHIVRPDYICANIDEAKRYPSSDYAIKYYGTEEKPKSRNIHERLKKEIAKLENYKKVHNARNRKSALVRCSYCQSKINREYISDSNICKVCGHEFYSNTDINKIKAYKHNIAKLIKEYEANTKKIVRWFVNTKYY